MRRIFRRRATARVPGKPLITLEKDSPMAMVNMQQSAEEAREDAGLLDTSTSDLPRYPYGLQLYLDDESLKKLGMSLPPIGSTMTLQAMVTVTSTSSNQTQGSEPETCLGLQITDMALAPAQGPSAADVLYGS